MSSNYVNMISLCKIEDLHREIFLFEEAFQQKFGLSLNDGTLLCALSEENELTCGALCEKFFLSPSNTSKIISHLEKKGLISRKFCETDKRQMLFSLTQKGKKSVQKIADTACEIPEHLAKIIL